MPTYAPTFLTMQNMVIDKLRLDAVADLTRVKNAINTASNNVAAETGYLSSTVVGAALVAGDKTKTLDPAIISLDYITCGFGGQSLVLGQLTEDRLYALRQQPSVAGPPMVYCLVSPNSVELWPNALGGEVLTYYGDILGQTLTNDGDPAPYPEPYGSNLLVYGALSDLSEYTKDILMIGTYQAKYADWMARFTAFCTNRQGALPKHMVVDDGTHSFVPHDRSSDWDVIGPRPV